MAQRRRPARGRANQPPPTPAFAGPLLAGAGAVFGLVAQVFGFPGAVVAYLFTVLGAFSAPAPELTGKKNQTGSPTPINASEEKLQQRYFFWSDLRFRLLFPTDIARVGLPPYASWLAAMWLGALALLLPQRYPVTSLANAIAIAALVAAITTGRRRIGRSGVPCGGVRFNPFKAIAWVKRNQTAWYEVAFFAGVPGAGLLMAAATYFYLPDYGVFWTPDRLDPFVYPALVGLATPFLVAAPFWVPEALRPWRLTCEAAEEWKPRWPILKQDPAPSIRERRNVGMATVDLFTAAPGVGAAAMILMAKKISEAAAGNRDLYLLPVEALDANGQPQPGTLHLTDFRIVSYPAGAANRPNILDPALSEEELHLWLECSLAEVGDGAMSPRMLVGQIRPIAILADQPTQTASTGSKLAGIPLVGKLLTRSSAASTPEDAPAQDRSDEEEQSATSARLFAPIARGARLLVGGAVAALGLLVLAARTVVTAPAALAAKVFRGRGTGEDDPEAIEQEQMVLGFFDDPDEDQYDDELEADADDLSDLPFQAPKLTFDENGRPIIPSLDDVDDDDGIDLEELEEEGGEPEPVGGTSPAWQVEIFMPQGPGWDLFRSSFGGMWGGRLGVQALVDHRAQNCFIGVFDDNLVLSDDAGVGMADLNNLAREDKWMGVWKEVHSETNAPVIQHATTLTEEIGRGLFINRQAFVIRKAETLESVFFGMDDKLTTAIDNATFATTTGWPKAGAARPGERNPTALTVYWSEMDLPQTPDKVPPKPGGGPEHGAKWLFTHIINRAFKAGKIGTWPASKPEVLSVTPLSMPNSRVHLWKLSLRLYGGVTVEQVRSGAERMRQALGSEYLQVETTKDGCHIVVGANPKRVRLADPRRLEPYLASLGWESAFTSAKVFGPTGAIPSLISSDVLPNNRDVKDLIFNLPEGMTVAEVRAKARVLESASKHAFVDVRPVKDQPTQMQLLACEHNPMPESVPYDFEHADESRLIPFATGIEGKPIEIDLKEIPHLLLAGTTGAGKSASAQVLVYGALLRGAQVAIIDPQKYAADFKIFADRCVGIATSIFEAEAMMRAIYAEVKRRAAMNGQYGVGHVRDLPNPPPPMVVFMDEFLGLIMAGKQPSTREEQDPELEKARLEKWAEYNAKKQIGFIAGRLAAEARSADVHLVLMTQKLINAMLDDDLKDLKTNMARILLGKANSGERMSALRDAEAAPSPGEFVPKGRGVWESTMESASLVQFWYTAPEVYRENLVARIPEVPEAGKIDLTPYLAAKAATVQPIFGERIDEDEVSAPVPTRGTVEESSVTFSLEELEEVVELPALELDLEAFDLDEEEGTEDRAADEGETSVEVVAEDAAHEVDFAPQAVQTDDPTDGSIFDQSYEDAPEIGEEPVVDDVEAFFAQASEAAVAEAAPEKSLSWESSMKWTHPDDTPLPPAAPVLDPVLDSVPHPLPVPFDDPEQAAAEVVVDEALERDGYSVSDDGELAILHTLPWDMVDSKPYMRPGSPQHGSREIDALLNFLDETPGIARVIWKAKALDTARRGGPMRKTVQELLAARGITLEPAYAPPVHSPANSDDDEFPSLPAPPPALLDRGGDAF